MENTNNEEIILNAKGANELVWRPGKACPLVLRRKGKPSWQGTCIETDDIHEWPTAPDSLKAAAREQWKRAGATVDESALGGAFVAKGPGGVLTIRTPEICERLRPLLAEQRAYAARVRAEQEARDAARAADLEALRARVRAECPADCEPCTLGGWYDGIQTYVAADGTSIEQWDGMDSHGCGIVYIKRDVVDDARKRAAERKRRDDEARAEQEANRKAEEARREECFRKARESGERVRIDGWITDRCHNGNDGDCSFDQATRWAMPDGTEKITYTCCY